MEDTFAVSNSTSATICFFFFLFVFLYIFTLIEEQMHGPAKKHFEHIVLSERIFDSGNIRQYRV
jgi:hypothetical protein